MSERPQRARHGANWQKLRLIAARHVEEQVARFHAGHVFHSDPQNDLGLGTSGDCPKPGILLKYISKRGSVRAICNTRAGGSFTIPPCLC